MVKKLTSFHALAIALVNLILPNLKVFVGIPVQESNLVKLAIVRHSSSVNYVVSSGCHCVASFAIIYDCLLLLFKFSGTLSDLGIGIIFVNEQLTVRNSVDYAYLFQSIKSES